MKEIFYEETATINNERSERAKYNIFRVLSILFYVLTVLYLIVVFFAYDWSGGNLLLNIIFVIIPFIMFLVSGIVFGKLKNKFCVEYDYTFVTGSIRVSKVIKYIKRKFIIKFETRDIEKIGEYGSQTYYKYEQIKDITKLTLTSNFTASENKKFYYIVANVDSDKKLMLFECREEFIINILKFSNKTVLEEELLHKK